MRLFYLCCLVVLSALPVAAQQGSELKALFQKGVDDFHAAKVQSSADAFNKLAELIPEAAAQLWQRGLSLYYIGDYKTGREQFEEHQKVNSADVENAAWHFICVAREENVEAARKALIPITGDARVPMKEIHDLLAGTGSPEAVMKAAEAGSKEDLRNQLCYAHLYLGLYFEALGDEAKAKEHIIKAATDYSMDHYMGKCAQVHMKVRGWDKPGAQ